MTKGILMYFILKFILLTFSITLYVTHTVRNVHTQLCKIDLTKVELEKIIEIRWCLFTFSSELVFRLQVDQDLEFLVII